MHDIKYIRENFENFKKKSPIEIIMLKLIIFLI